MELRGKPDVLEVDDGACLRGRELTEHVAAICGSAGTSAIFSWCCTFL